jgi:hypothetical protein
LKNEKCKIASASGSLSTTSGNKRQWMDELVMEMASFTQFSFQ